MSCQRWRLLETACDLRKHEFGLLAAYSRRGPLAARMRPRDGSTSTANCFGKRREVLVEDVANDVRVHPEVFMHDDVPETGDGRPRHLRTGGLVLVWQSFDGLANDGKVAQHGVIGLSPEVARVQK